MISIRQRKSKIRQLLLTIFYILFNYHIHVTFVRDIFLSKGILSNLSTPFPGYVQVFINTISPEQGITIALHYFVKKYLYI